MLTPECPACKKLIQNVTLQETRIGPLLSDEGYRGLIYQCPFCAHVLGVGMDPISLKHDIVIQTADEVLSRIGSTLQQIANSLNQLLSRRG